MSLYEKVDSVLVQGANVGVHAWNWTTGRTRADLGNILDAGGSAFLNLSLYNSNKTIGLVAFPFLALGSYFNIKKNNEQDELEVKAAKDGLSDIRVEVRKGHHKVFGTTYGAIAAAGGVASVSHSGLIMINLANTALALNCYVMRASYLPPRKNCLVRGLDHLSEALSELNTVPVPVPVRVYQGEKIK